MVSFDEVMKLEIWAGRTVLGCFKHSALFTTVLNFVEVLIRIRAPGNKLVCRNLNLLNLSRKLIILWGTDSTAFQINSEFRTCEAQQFLLYLTFLTFNYKCYGAEMANFPILRNDSSVAGMLKHVVPLCLLSHGSTAKWYGSILGPSATWRSDLGDWNFDSCKLIK